MARFHGAITQLARMSGKDFEQTIKAELGAVLNAAQRNTIKASVKSITQRVENQAAKRMDGKIYILSNRYSDTLWKRIRDSQKRKLNARKGARGLAAKMWVHIGNQLGIQVNAPGYVAQAKTGRGDDMSRAISVQESGRGQSYSVGFINSLTGSNIGGKAGAAFNRALSGRANYFSQSMKLAAKGVIRGVLDRYPGLGRVS